MLIIKLKIFILFLILVFLAGCTKEKGITTSGIILADETWSGNITITGDITIMSSATVTVLPGTNVHVAANQDDRNTGGEHIIDELTKDDPSATEQYTKTHTSISVLGELVSVGTKDKWIAFTSNASNPYNTDWDGIIFNPGSKGEMKYTIVEYTHTGPALHKTDDVIISHCIVRHTFWGGLHAFENSPVFEYNVLDDIGHEAFDTHEASPIIRHNNISHARVAMVINNYKDKQVIIEDNYLYDNNHLLALQDNAYAVIRNNRFSASNDTGGPWHYKGFTLDVQDYGEGFNINDNANIEIYNNTFEGFINPVFNYELIGPNKGVRHTTNAPEEYEIKGPVQIRIENNYFDAQEQLEWLEEFAQTENVYVKDNLLKIK